MRLHDLVITLDEIAPIRFAETWDNVGLLAGDPQQSVSKAILTIDYTPAVAAEATAIGADVVIAYHPPIFTPVKRLTANSSSGLVFDAIRRGVAIYSPHTAIDVAPGGTNDMLADALGLPADDRQPLRIVQPKANQYKLVTFVPKDALPRVSEALFAAGAGHIGNYSHCSFQIDGRGTFVGEEGTNPTVGQSGRLETTAEVRLETVLPIARLNDALTALRASHPYEEPAFDLVQLAAPPEKTGQGRIGNLKQPVARRELIERIKTALNLDHLLIAGPTDGDATRLACCAGSCGDLLDDAIAQHADLYLTGEMKHHEALRAAASGMTVICTLHSNSERAVLRRIQAKLRDALPNFPTHVSEHDRDPFVIV
ncbi:MAG TPA: Nif3-like dinuclear metal center hexameric protein [Tepidisphaeraceae bacterium]|jgi:dinuclear metal center YbgI/SA1388 family protein|nr:Nif3-like dinuclear metal center hexameric protein [Tepidisphaeraceae bacterium]